MEAPDQSKQGRVGHRLVPVIENGAERRLASDEADDGAEDDGHPQQRDQASAKADAGEGGEDDQNAHAQAKADEYLGRSQLTRKIRQLRQDLGLLGDADPGVRSPLYAKLSQQTGVHSSSALRGTVGTLVLRGGVPVRRASTNALRMASGRSA